MHLRCTLTMIAASLAFAQKVFAVELGNEGDLASVEVHAFASQGFIFTTKNNYLADNTTHGSFQFSEIGLNFTKSLSDNLRMGLQLFAQDLGPTGSFDANVDWFYLDYRWKDWLGFRAGRVKIPFGLYNEINDVDSARVPILLPQSVYPVENTNFLLAQTGGEIYGYLSSRAAGALEYRLYGGTILVDTLIPPGTPYQVQDLYVPYVAGGRVVWETPLEGLRFAGSVQALKINAALVASEMPVTVTIPAELWVASAEYSAHDLLVSAEYTRWYVKVTSTNPMLFPETPLTTSERGYVMASYRATRWLQPGLYYALEFPNVANRNASDPTPGHPESGRQNVQHDVAATLRFDINSHWLVKLEGHFMSGTAELNSSLNDGTSLSNLDRNWEVFLAKTTAYF
jgi:hypothetical protein